MHELSAVQSMLFTANEHDIRTNEPDYNNYSTKPTSIAKERSLVALNGKISWRICRSLQEKFCERYVYDYENKAWKRIVKFRKCDSLEPKDLEELEMKENFSWFILNRGNNFYSSIGSAEADEGLRDWINNLFYNKILQEAWNVIESGKTEELDSYIEVFAAEMISHYQITGAVENIKQMLKFFLSQFVDNLFKKYASSMSSLIAETKEALKEKYWYETEGGCANAIYADICTLKNKHYNNFIYRITDFLNNQYMKFSNAEEFVEADGYKALKKNFDICYFA